VEVIVVDDGSMDETPERLSALTDPRLRVVTHETARGVASARNSGIAAARGDWIAFHDDDDLWSPRKLQTQLEGLGAAGWGYASVIVVDHDNRPLYALPLPDPTEVTSGLMRGNIIPGGPSNVIGRASLVHEVGGFDERLSHSADWDMWIRLARSGQPSVCTEVLVATLQHSRRMIFRDQPDVIREVKTLFAKYDGPSRQQLRSVAEWLAFTHHREGHRLRAAGLYLRAAVAYRSPGNLPAAVGALFGEPGLRLASGLLRGLRGGSHLEHDVLPVPAEPEWLERYRGENGLGP